MNLETLGRLVAAGENAIKEVGSLVYKREAYYELEKYLESKSYLGFYGLRGVGKTTILKMLTAKASEKHKSIYVNCESSYLLKYSLDEIIQSLYKEGYEQIFIDEIHEKSNWENAILTAFNETKTKIIFTGSSAIAIQTGKDRGDLTRKTTFFHVPPISFREYLLFREKAEKIKTKKIAFDKLLSKPRKHAIELIETEKLYDEYTRYGGMMYDVTDYGKFTEQVMAGIKRSIEKDLNVIKGLTVKEQNDALSILYLIAKSPGYEITKENIGQELGTSWRETQTLLDVLEKIGFLRIVSACGKEGERKGTGKIYLPIPLRYAFAMDEGFVPDVGTMREEFFIQHAANCRGVRKVCYPKGQRRKPDFLIDGKYFEIGGKHKGKGQQADYYVLDKGDASDKTLPLFLFGFIY